MNYILLQLYDSDCGQLIPPCWQELHYLIAGVFIAFPLALWFWMWLYRWWTSQTDS